MRHIKMSAVKTLSQFFMKAGVIIMAISLLSAAGCNFLNKDTANKIASHLETKYGGTFVVERIGNRLNTDTVTAYCYASSRSDLLFEATMDKDGLTLTDNYINRIIGRQVEDILVSAFKAYNVDIQAFVSVYNPQGMPASADIILTDFVDQYKPQMFIANIVMPDSLQSPETSDELARSLNDAYLKILTDVQCKIKVIPADKFNDCGEWLRNEPDFNETLIGQNYGIQKSFTVEVTADGVKAVDNFYDRQ